MTADKQLKAYIDRVLRLKEEQDALGDDIREIYAEAKAEGYDKTIMGKLVAHLRRELKQGAGAVAEAESIFDTYLTAYQRASGTPVATHTHASEAHDPETGEILEDINPRLAKQVVDGMQTEAGRAALTAAVDILIEQEEAEEASNGGPSAVRPSLAARDVEESAAANPVANVGEGATSTTAAASNDPASRTDDESERQHSSTVGFADDCRTGGKEQSDASAAPVGDADAEAHGIPAIHQPETAQETMGGTGDDCSFGNRGAWPPQEGASSSLGNDSLSVVTVVGTESGTVSNGSRPADPAVSGGEPGTPSSDAGGEKMELGSNPVPGRRDVKSLHNNAESERATNTNSQSDDDAFAEVKGSARLANADGVEPSSSEAVADQPLTGGDHVNAQSNAATHGAGALVKPAPARKPLRPLCRNPGEHCGGYGSNHCNSCLRAAKEAEAA